MKLGKKRRKSSKRNYYIISPRVMTKAIIIAGGTQGRLRGAPTSQEIAKYVAYCENPGKSLGPNKCPNELLKTMSDEEFLILQVWVSE